MKRQNEMMESFMRAHRDFMTNLGYSTNLLEHDIAEAAEMGKICTDEWCIATEHTLDELANMIFSISEPRWATNEDSEKIRSLRHRVHDLYAKYKSVTAR
jgi:hypothetical protein